MPSFLICFIVRLPVSISPAWFSTTKSTPWPLSAILIASTQACGPGAAKILPATEISIIPSPTKPLIAGSWPVPPKVTMVTRSASANFLFTMRLSCSKVIMSGLDNTRPSNNSLVRFSGLLMNFCIMMPPISILIFHEANASTINLHCFCHCNEASNASNSRAIVPCSAPNMILSASLAKDFTSATFVKLILIFTSTNVKHSLEIYSMSFCK